MHSLLFYDISSPYAVDRTTHHRSQLLTFNINNQSVKDWAYPIHIIVAQEGIISLATYISLVVINVAFIIQVEYGVLRSPTTYIISFQIIKSHPVQVDDKGGIIIHT